MEIKLETRQKRPRVRNDIQKKLARMIAEGDFAPGDFLPAEAMLARTFEVSRTALREAIKGLEAKFMVRSRPRVGTIVLPREDWAILDPDVLGWIADLLDVDAFIETVLEARQAIEPAAAQLACRRAKLTDLAAIETALETMKVSMHDAQAFTDADLAFHEALLLSSHNPVFAQLIHSIRAGLNLMLLTSNRSVEDYSITITTHQALLDALIKRDVRAAEKASLAIVDRARSDLRRRGKVSQQGA